MFLISNHAAAFELWENSFCASQPALFCASLPLCIQNELQLIKNKPCNTCNICIRFQSVGEKNVISPQQNIKEKEKKLKTCDQFFEIFFLQRYFLIVPTVSALGGVTKFMVFKRLENIGVNLLMAFKLACTIGFIPLCFCLKCSIYYIKTGLRHSSQRCGYQKEFAECFVNWSVVGICGSDGSSDIGRRQNKILEKTFL